MKALIFCLFFIFLFNVNASSQTIGGFGAPIYFTKFNSSEINSINAINTVKMIKIIYPSNLHNLAVQIANHLKNKNIVFSETNLQNTATVQYRQDAVIVVLYFGH